MRTNNRIYHIDCFRCFMCNKQLSPGDEFALKDDGILCKSDNEIYDKHNGTSNMSNLLAPITTNPISNITNQHPNLMNMTTPKHLNKCDEFNDYEDNQNCISDQQQQGILHPSHHQMPQMSMPQMTNLSNHHAHHLTQQQQNSRLNHMNYNSNLHQPPGPPQTQPSSLVLPTVSTPSSIVTSKNESNNNNSNGGSSVSSTNSSGNHHHGGHGHHRKDKTTRIRTVLNEKQLHTLRTCYGANPRPDALMKEQLVEMTSLSPRVIRVWFQNKRCKDKKKTILIKQMQEQQKVSITTSFDFIKLSYFLNLFFILRIVNQLDMVFR
jgi:hypothetical protein